MVVQIVRFKSGLSDGEVVRMYETRAPRYRDLQGLIEKYYLRFPETNEHGAVYVWESKAALNEFRESELGRTISTAYQVQGRPQAEMAEVVMTLRGD